MFDDKRPGARLIGGALVGVMIFGTALGADAATKKKPKRVVKHTRTVTLKYTGGCTAETPAVTGSPTGACSTLGAAGYTIDARPGEKYVSIKVADATGRNVPGQFWESGISTVPKATEIGFCGALKPCKCFSVRSTCRKDCASAGASTAAHVIVASARYAVMRSPRQSRRRRERGIEYLRCWEPRRAF